MTKTMKTTTLHLPQTHLMTTTTLPQTPLSKLQAEKHQLEVLCKKQEERLAVHARYLQDNAGSLLLSGVSALLSSSGTPKAEKEKADSASQRQGARSFAQRQAAAPTIPGLPMGLSTLLKVPKMVSIGAGWMPLAWQVAQPLLITWSIKRVKRIIGGAFTRKKKK